MGASVKRRVVRAAGWRVAKRLLRPIPIIGTAVALGLAGYEIRKKGLLRGLVHVGLDATPVIGTVKGVIEIFSGDLIRDRERRPREASAR